MICAFCGGQVLWMGPLSNMTHTQCQKCGRKNCQLPNDSEPEDQDFDAEYDETEEDAGVSEQWYCPDCGPITKMREEFLSGGYMCAECEAPASPIPAFVTVLQQQIAERDAELSLYRNGYKGACYACESVGELNVSLNIINKGLDEANIIFADRIATLEAACEASARWYKFHKRGFPIATPQAEELMVHYLRAAGYLKEEG